MAQGCSKAVCDECAIGGRQQAGETRFEAFERFRAILIAQHALLCTIEHVVKIWHLERNQDGGGRHLGERKSNITFERLERSPSNVTTKYKPNYVLSASSAKNEAGGGCFLISKKYCNFRTTLPQRGPVYSIIQFCRLWMQETYYNMRLE